MSRRTVIALLAVSAALTATQAAADPECFGQSCRLPMAVEPPAAMPPTAMPPPPLPASALDANASAAPRESVEEDTPRPPVVSRERVVAPRPASNNPLGLAPSSERALFAAEPAPRRPLRDFEPPALRAAEPRRFETERTPSRIATRVEQGSIDSGPLYGIPFTPRAVGIGVPAVIYGGFGVRPVYLVAPSAKIIHVDRDE